MGPIAVIMAAHSSAGVLGEFAVLSLFSLFFKRGLVILQSLGVFVFGGHGMG